MEQYSDSELEFIRREIIKKYTNEALSSDDIVKEIPQYPKSVGDEKFNFLSEYVEKTLHSVSKNSKVRLEELDEFSKDNYRPNYSLSATLKKLYCEQHYKKPVSERKSEQFKFKSINRFYLYFSGKRRNDFWKEKGATEINKILCDIQTEIDAFRHPEINVATTGISEGKQIFEKENPAETVLASLQTNRPSLFYKAGFIVLALLLFCIVFFYWIVLKPSIDDSKQKLSVYQTKIIRTPAHASEVPGLIGNWYSYNRTPEANEDNRLKGKIFRGIEWRIDSDRNGNLTFSRPTTINENDGWIELINMQINFFLNVHPKFGDKNSEQNLGFRHFICKPNTLVLSKADTLWCVCTSFIYKDGRLDDPLASREIMIRKKEGQVYPSDLMMADSMPEGLRALLPKEKSYLRLLPY